MGGIGSQDNIGPYGSKGFKYINDTNAHAGNFFYIEILTDTIFNAIVGNYTGTITGITFTKGTKIYGLFTSITPASGTMLAYNS